MLVNTPTHVLDSIAQAKEGVKSTLDELQSLGILQQSNRMDLKHLLNPIEEQNYMLVELSNQDICDVVLKAMAGKDDHADKRDDSDTEDEVAVRPQPTRSKTLEAISMIQSYVEDIDGGFCAAKGSERWLPYRRTTIRPRACLEQAHQFLDGPSGAMKG